MQIIKYDKKYKKEIPELFTNTIHKTCNKEYTKEQLKAWANPIQVMKLLYEENRRL